jgi:DNA-binding GntR family transcriptional regulator
LEQPVDSRGKILIVTSGTDKRNAPKVRTRSSNNAASFRVMELVKQDILSGGVKPGQRLVETEIAQRLNISRPAVREGLRLLSAEGIVQIEHNRGARVRLYTRADMLALHQIREVIEGLAAMLAASRAALTDLGHRLIEINREIEQALDREDKEAYLELNTRFHDTILEMSGNQLLAPHIAEVRMAFGRLQTSDLRLSDLRQSLKEHQEITETIISGLPQAAESAMRRHIRSSRTFILSLPHVINE